MPEGGSTPSRGQRRKCRAEGEHQLSIRQGSVAIFLEGALLIFALFFFTLYFGFNQS
jgi:hypothetical protein